MHHPPRTTYVLRSRSTLLSNLLPHIQRARVKASRWILRGQVIAGRRTSGSHQPRGRRSDHPGISRRGRRIHGSISLCSVIQVARRPTAQVARYLSSNVPASRSGPVVPTDIATRPSSTGGARCMTRSDATRCPFNGWSSCRNCRPPDTGMPISSSTRC